jgi:hypothetical protein
MLRPAVLIDFLATKAERHKDKEEISISGYQGAGHREKRVSGKSRLPACWRGLAKGGRGKFGH